MFESYFITKAKSLKTVAKCHESAAASQDNRRLVKIQNSDLDQHSGAGQAYPSTENGITTILAAICLQATIKKLKFTRITTNHIAKKMQPRTLDIEQG